MQPLAPMKRRLLEMFRQGCTQQEMARDLNVSERAVRRVLERLRHLAN